MSAPSGRRLSDRDLRALSTTELLKLIEQDIQELDQLAGLRRRRKQDKKPSRKRPGRGTADEPEEAPPGPALHTVTCCNYHMGDFPAFAQVRCPFCGQWHRAGDFPQVS